MSSTSDWTSTVLQVFAGWALAAGIVPSHETVTVLPSFAGTVTPWVGGVAAPICRAPVAQAAPTRRNAQIGRSRPTPRRRFRSIRVSLRERTGIRTVRPAAEIRLAVYSGIAVP